MLLIGARDFKQALVEHYYAKRAKGNPGSDLYFIHVVNLEVAGLFNPVFNEGIAQGMLGVGLRKIGPFDYETIFAHVASKFTRRVGLTLSPWSLTIQQNNEGQARPSSTPWVDRGSKKYLWTEADVIKAVAYLEYDQGEPLD